MKIAIDAADLCDHRVDGTRVYIKNVLDHLGGIAPDDTFFIYLKGELNPELTFKLFDNYKLRQSKAPFFWTQSKFPFELKKDKPDVLWMPLQTIPFITGFKKNGLKIVSTIHDLAFKYYPDYFPKKDLFLLTLFTKFAVKNSDKIIAVSNNTKGDLQKFYKLKSEKIAVVYHGFNSKIFNPIEALDQVGISKIREKYGIRGDYLIYAGALQPRKNLVNLIKAFEKVKSDKDQGYGELKLVLAGKEAWMAAGIKNKAKSSSFSQDIIFTGGYKTRELPKLLGGSKAFIFPSFYEGFGIPTLEAMSCQTPVIAADNSSLPEVGEDACQYFKADDYKELADKIKEVLNNDELRGTMKEKGLEQVKNFSWEKCARETLAVLKS